MTALPQTDLNRSPSLVSLSSSIDLFETAEHIVNTLEDVPNTLPTQGSPTVGPSKNVDQVPVGVVREHERFYYEDGSVKFLVEDMLYNVHRSILSRNSSWFQSRFIKPADYLPPGWECHQSPRGEKIYVNHILHSVSFTRPRVMDKTTGAIILENITVKEFDTFLSILYPSDYDTFELTTNVEWIAVLKLVDMWSFKSMRVLVINQLESSLSCRDLFALGHAHQIKGWVDLATRTLSSRVETPQVDELRAMASEDIASVIAARKSTYTHPKVVDDSRQTSQRADSTGVKPSASPTLLADADFPAPAQCSSPVPQLDHNPETSYMRHESETTNTQPNTVAIQDSATESGQDDIWGAWSSRSKAALKKAKMRRIRELAQDSST